MAAYNTPPCAGGDSTVGGNAMAGRAERAGTGDAETTKPGRTAATHRGHRSANDHGSILVLVEPPSSRRETSGSELMSEGTRIARELDIEPRFVTWPAGPDVDLEALAEALADLIGRTRPVAIVLVDTDIGRQLAPMLGYRLGSAAVLGCSDVVIDGELGRRVGASCPGYPDGVGQRTLTFIKPIYGGWLEQEIVPEPGTVPVATLDLSGMDEQDSPPGEAPTMQAVKIEATRLPRVRHLELLPPDARLVDLVHARRIVAAGSGASGEGLLAAAGELAELLEGSVGATRPLVDDGLLPQERLIGQTGKTVSPELYFALGVSGSPHHVAGVRRADRILSIDRDMRAPIFQFSDVGYVADLEVVLPALVQKIKEWRDAPGGRE